MLNKLVVMLFTAFMFTATFAAGPQLVDTRVKTFKAEKETVFSLRKYIDVDGREILAGSEDFAMLNVESDVDFTTRVQDEEAGEDRDNVMALGYNAAHHVLLTAYGVVPEQVHVGNMYLGQPSLAPEGMFIVVEVRFISNGLMYRGRVAQMLVPASDGGVKGLYFLYPYTR